MVPIVDDDVKVTLELGVAVPVVSGLPGNGVVLSVHTEGRSFDLPVADCILSSIPLNSF